MSTRLQADMLFDQGLAAEEAGDMNTALTLYHRALSTEPLCPEVLVNIGTIHWKRKQLRLAEQHYRKAIKFDNQYAMAHYNLARVLEDLNKDAEAMTYYERAIAIFPQYADAHYNLAHLYEKRKEGRKARYHCREYLRYAGHDPGFREVAQKMMERLRSFEIHKVL